MSVINLHIGIFGRVNTGKSSLINMLTGQDISIVSNIKGTTTDPVKKTVEVFGLGPATIIDTAGIDDLSEIGLKKIKKSLEVILRVDCAILLISGNQFGDYEVRLINQLVEYKVPYLIVHNKNDVTKIAEITKKTIRLHSKAEIIDISTYEPSDKQRLVSALKRIIPKTIYQQKTLLGDLVKPKDIVLLIVAFDSEAPEGRMILPQNQTIRDVLDNDCMVIILKESELVDFMKLDIIPSLVIADSQLFNSVTKIVPESIPLTSFSILFARLKGDFAAYLNGTLCISSLKGGDNILILESCTHHTSCDDIGSKKIPKLLQEFTDKKLNFEVVAGLSELPANKCDYDLVIQCGGCMATRKQIQNRLQPFIKCGVPVTNYGMVLAYVNNSFDRATKVFRRFYTYDKRNPKLPFIEG